MKVTVTEQSASERTLEVVVDAKQVESAFQKAFKKNLKQFTLPGFRKGKVPQSMAERYITDGALVKDVVNEVVPRAFEDAIKEKKLEPISQPDWDLVQNERGKDLVFKASFLVAPFVELKGYDGMEIEVEREEISEEHISDTLNRMREQHGEFVTLEEDRGLVEGDYATVDYTSFQDGEEIENGSVTNYLMEMKPQNYIDGFVSNLVGSKPGDEKEFDISFPDDYNNSELAGETITFKFKVHDIKVKQLPELDDEFAKSHTEHQTIEALKSAIRERLEDGVTGQADGQAVTDIAKKLLEQVPEEIIPAQLRQHHAQKVIRSRMYEMSKQGIGLEQLLQARGITQDVWIQEMMGAGLFEARLEVLYKSLAQLEDIAVEDKEIDEIIKTESKSYKMSPKQLRKQMEKNGALEMLQYNLLTEKLSKLLLEKAKVSYLAPGSKKKESENSAGGETSQDDAKAEKKKPKAKAKAEGVQSEPKESEPKAEKTKAGKSKKTEPKAKPVDEAKKKETAKSSKKASKKSSKKKLT